MSAVLSIPTTDIQPRELTDGFHLVIDALKLNDIDTIFGLPGIPVTDLCRMAQAEGMRDHVEGRGVSPAPVFSKVDRGQRPNAALGMIVPARARHTFRRQTCPPF